MVVVTRFDKGGNAMRNPDWQCTSRPNFIPVREKKQRGRIEVLISVQMVAGDRKWTGAAGKVIK